MKLNQPQESTNIEPMNYFGPSMIPSLRPGDELEIVAYDQQQIRKGDVIVFIPPGGDAKIVHRVVSVVP